MFYLDDESASIADTIALFVIVWIGKGLGLKLCSGFALVLYIQCWIFSGNYIFNNQRIDLTY